MVKEGILEHNNVQCAAPVQTTALLTSAPRRTMNEPITFAVPLKMPGARATTTANLRRPDEA